MEAISNTTHHHCLPLIGWSRKRDLSSFQVNFRPSSRKPTNEAINIPTNGLARQSQKFQNKGNPNLVSQGIRTYTLNQPAADGMPKKSKEDQKDIGLIDVEFDFN